MHFFSLSDTVQNIRYYYILPLLLIGESLLHNLRYLIRIILADIRRISLLELNLLPLTQTYSNTVIHIYYIQKYLQEDQRNGGVKMNRLNIVKIITIQH